MKYPITPAIRELRQHKVDFEPKLYKYVARGGAEASARLLSVPLEQVVKTLIFEDENKQPLVVLMNGNHEVSTKQLARLLNVKTIQSCDPAVAQKHSGYLVGGTSPFGTKRKMPVYMEESITALPQIYLNGGKRGFLVALDPAEVVRVLKPELVQVAV